MEYSHWRFTLASGDARRRDTTVGLSRLGVASVNWIADDRRRISVKNLKTEQIQNLSIQCDRVQKLSWPNFQFQQFGEQC